MNGREVRLERGPCIDSVLGVSNPSPRFSDLYVVLLQGMGLPEDALVAVPFATHGTAGSGDTCVLAMTADFLFAFGAKATMNTTCLAETAPPDFEGTTAGMRC